ncbi:MAG TPA: T9SS type A sorting domain-containing protein [Hanamia sp.]|nr:T9SS type A sorting domain-containing protein [Hanamia sp.]
MLIFAPGHLNFVLTNNGISYTGNVTWVSSNTSVATISPIGNPEILTKGGDGTVDITATINSCGITVNRFKTINVGSPNMSNFNFEKNGPSCVTASYQPVSFGVSYKVGTNVFTGCSLKDLAGITEVEWQISSPYGYQLTNNSGIYNCLSGTVDKAGISVGFQMPANNSYVVTIRYRVKNGCDWSFWSPGNYHIVQKCGFGFTVSPNPANSSINVVLDQQSDMADKTMSIHEIQITDKIGNVVKQLNYLQGNSKVLFDISDLKQDIYFIRVNNGKEWQTQQFSRR